MRGKVGQEEGRYREAAKKGGRDGEVEERIDKELEGRMEGRIIIIFVKE